MSETGFQTLLRISRASAIRLANLSNNFNGSADPLSDIAYLRPAPELLLREYFYANQHNTVNMHHLGCRMEIDRRTDTFFLAYDSFLVEMPEELINLDIGIIDVKIEERNNASTNAPAGVYRNTKHGLTATVRRTIADGYASQEMEGLPSLYIRHITVNAKTLAGAIRYHSEICQGAHEPEIWWQHS